MEKKRFNIEGMTCAACKAHVDKAVRKVNGVIDVNVNLLTNSMEVKMEDGIKESDINKAVENAGYKSYIKENKENNDKNDNNETKSLAKRLIYSVITLVPLFILSMGYMMMWFPNLMEYPLTVTLVEFILSSIIIFINKKFFISGFKAMLHKEANMDTLVALGSGVAYIYSLVLFFIMTINYMNHEYIYSLSMNLSFETSAMILTFITIGKTLESYSKGKTTNAIKSLINLAPKEANVIRDGNEVKILAKDINIDDIFIVRPGESIPVDGIIIEGNTSIDESMLTGESIPVDKIKGDKVSQGTINKLGEFRAKVSKVGEDTTLSQIIKLVEEASSTKTKISRLADKVAGIFSPIVLGLAIIIFIVWLILGLNGITYFGPNETILSYAIDRAISVLVISCPCALGLATPVAIMVGSGRSAKNGILFKNAEALENSANVKFVVLDKTGTITKGEPKIKNIIPFDIESDELMKLASSLENKSSHPLAKAIVSEYNKEYYDVDNFNTLLGFGVEGYINNKKILGVNLEYAKKHNFVNQNQIDKVNELASKGQTPLLFIYDEKLIGIISVADYIKEDSKEAIEKIKKLGIIPIMLTGDNELTAKSIASEVGIDYYLSNVLPEGKQDLIKKLKNYGNVMMVGDGINDAIALSEANIGVAIGNGTDIAIESADIILMKSNLLDLYKAIRMSQKTLLNIKENLFWAFIYNLIMIPLAAGIFASIGVSLKPWYGAASMSLSSVTVVLNALRLNIVNIYKNRKVKKANNIDLESILNKKLKEDNMEQVLMVEGMMCNHCAMHVENACKSVEGVKDAKVSLENKSVTITSEASVDLNKVREAIKNAGYEPKF